VKDVLTVDGSSEWRPFNRPSNYLKSGRVHHPWFSPKERDAYIVKKEFEHLAMTFDLPRSLVATSMDLYDRLCVVMNDNNCGIKRRTVRRGLKAACLYFAFRLLDIPREQKEIARMLDEKPSVVTKGCVYFENVTGMTFEPLSPSNLLNRFCGVFVSVNRKTLEDVLQAVRESPTFDGLSPITLVSGCIYHLSVELDLGISKETIHSTCGVSIGLITKTQKLLKSHLMPNAPNAPKAPKAPKTPNAPKAPKAPKTPKAPKIPKTPKVPR
jgi:transcription initiation factor TFIIIB Brf1 subunit/transcription initiation factor TFIIB